MGRDKLDIILGPHWAEFALAREGMAFLGTVQRGMQIGALARLVDGSHAQVNGDVVELLNSSRVEHALRKLSGTSQWGRAMLRSGAAAPVVIVKKKRRIPLPTDDGASPRR